MDSPRRSLSENLRALLARPGDKLAVRTIAEQVGDKGFGVLLAVLSLPSALPVPAPGYSTPFGILLALLGLQMTVGRPRPWLPERALRREISRDFAGRIFGAATRFLGWTERLIRPRMRWINRKGGRIFLGAVVLAMACLMILPIPLTNTAPAAVVFLVGVALAEDDGLVAVGAFVAGLLAVAFYAYVIYLLATVGMDGVLRLKDWIKELVLG